jgi:hypothetical protein
MLQRSPLLRRAVTRLSNAEQMLRGAVFALEDISTQWKVTKNPIRLFEIGTGRDIATSGIDKIQYFASVISGQSVYRSPRQVDRSGFAAEQQSRDETTHPPRFLSGSLRALITRLKQRA